MNATVRLLRWLRIGGMLGFGFQTTATRRGNVIGLLTVLMVEAMAVAAPPQYEFWIELNPDGTFTVHKAWTKVCPTGDLVIPDTIRDRKVTGVGREAFNYCTDLTSVTIPEGITTIGEGAFRNTGLANVTIPRSVTSIGDAAFSDCRRLTHVTISEGVTSIGRGTFAGCTSLTSVKIPNSVTSIGNGVFSGCTGLTSVSIPEGVTSIGNGAFSGCTGLTSVSIPEGVTSIGNGAFAWSGLTSVTISAIVTNIGDSTFSGCSALLGIEVEKANPNYVSLDGVLFDKALIRLMQYPSGKAGIYTIPDSVASIGNEAFSGCAGLTSVTIPDSVTSIESRAFARSGLTSVTIPATVTNVGEYAFGGCSALLGIEVARRNPSYTSLDGVLFDKALTQLMQYPSGRAGNYTIPGSVTSIGGGALAGCAGLTGITIPDSVSSLAETFSGCTGLTSIVIPRSVGYLLHTFLECTQLRSVYFEGRPPAIGCCGNIYADAATMYYLPGVPGWPSTYAYRPTAPWRPSIQYPGIRLNRPGFTVEWARNSVVEVEACADLANPVWSRLGDLALISGSADFDDPNPPSRSSRFYRVRAADFVHPEGVNYHRNADDTLSLMAGCAVGELTIPRSIEGRPVKDVWPRAFQHCSGLASVTIPDGVTRIGREAFSGCMSLASVTIPHGVTSIGADAFRDCARLTKVTIPGGVTSIEAGTFADCTSLSSVTILDGVRSIGYAAFWGCTGLASLTIPGSVTRIENDAFSDCASLAAVTIPRGVNSIGDGAFHRCGGLTSIIIPGSVTSIGGGAFASCASLKAAYFEGNPPSAMSDLAFTDWDGRMTSTTVYYLPGTRGWSSTLAGRPTAPWHRAQPTILDFGDRFGPSPAGFSFVISWATNVPVVVEASANIGGADWTPISTNTLTDAWVQFNDPEWKSRPARYYRVRGE